MLVPSTTRGALFKGMLKNFYSSNYDFHTFHSPIDDSKNYKAIENLRIPFDRAHRVVFGTSIGTFGTGS